VPPYFLQSLYRRISSPALRLAAIRGARSLGVRHLVTRIDTNDVCNLKCVMCPLSDPDRVPAAKPMPVEQFKRAADDLLPRTRYLYLSCSTEPLATPHFDKILDAVSSHRVPFVSFCTNGHLFRDRFIDATLRNRVNEVIFSVDGATKETYEEIRVGGKWEDLEDRLAAFTDARRRHAGRKPEVRFNFTVQDTNCGEVSAFVDWARQWDASLVQFRVFRPLLGAVKQGDGGETIATYERELELAQAKCDELGIQLLADPPRAWPERSESSDTAPQPSPASEESAPGRWKINCQLPWITVYVRADGSLYPCGGHPAIGNIFDSSYGELEKQDTMVDLRQSLKTSCPKDVCVECQRTGASGV